MSYDPNQTYEADYRVREDGQIERTPKAPARWKQLLGPLGFGLIFLATKFKFIFASLKGVKFIGTGITAILSIGAYALLFPWQFAIGVVVLIFIHELGHVFVLRRYGVAATAPIFIPFLGAYIGMKEMPKNAVMEAYVGLGGPVIGSLAAFAAYGIYQVTDSLVFLALAYIGILLNLFNLLPILPLDGGRAVGAISRWFWVIGFGGLVLLIFLRPSPILFLILLFGAPELYNAIRGRGDEEYYKVPASDRLAIAAIYFGLLIVLGYSMYELGGLMEANKP